MLGHDVSLDVHLRSNGVLDPCCCLRHVVVELGIVRDEVLAQLGDAVGETRAAKPPKIIS